MSQKIEGNSFWKLWKQFLPLSVSDVTMACGDPMITTVLAHMPQATANLGALGAAKSIAIFFESPIIMLLHASNALSPSQKSRAALRRFMLIALGVLTLLLTVICIPAFFDHTVGAVMNLPPEVSSLAKQALVFFVLWPAAIGWRRYYQGLLIRYHHASSVAKAGFFRLAVVAIALIAGFYLNVSSIHLAGAALVLGVIVEALMVTFYAKKFHVTASPELVSDPRLPSDLKGVWKFYWPLANSMLVVWGGRVLLIAIIARSVDASIALAAWPAAWGLILVVANATRMIQQVIIKNRGHVKDGSLLVFAASVGALFSLILVSIGFSSLGQRIITAFVGQDPNLVAAVTPVIIFCSVVPLLIACQNAIQGFLITENKTSRINASTWIGTGVLLIIGFLAINASVLGATAAAFAMTSALVAEILWLSLGLNAVLESIKNKAREKVTLPIKQERTYL